MTFDSKLQQATQELKRIEHTPDAPLAERVLVLFNGRNALESVCSDNTIDIGERTNIWLNAPDVFKNKGLPSPGGSNPIVNMFITDLAYSCFETGELVNTTFYVQEMLQAYLLDPNAKYGWKNNIPVKSMLEEILKRNMLSFEFG